MEIKAINVYRCFEPNSTIQYLLEFKDIFDMLKAKKRF